MAKNFASIAFTSAIKDLQKKYGSRKNYERIEKYNVLDGLGINEADFIRDRDSFYLSTIGTNDYPYIQHRGGPKGFLKVLDSKRLGFIDFKGNMQYISLGNMTTNNKTALIMVDYPSKSRLKIYAKSELVELEENPELLKLLGIEDYKYRSERMMIFHIEAFDWNCSQHITSRYAVEEIEESFSIQSHYIYKLEEEIKSFKSKFPAIKNNEFTE